MNKRLFAIQVPEAPRIQNEKFVSFIAAEAGGCSRRVVDGYWRDDKTGKMHIEKMAEYQIACDPALMFDIQAKAMQLWPKEICFYVAEIGTVSIVYPPAKTQVATA